MARAARVPRPRGIRSAKLAKKMAVPKHLRSVTPLVYYGGKSRDAEEIVNSFPPHDGFADVFGGGGAITFFHKTSSTVDIYNDIGNVSNFFWVLQNYGDELYDKLYLSNWSRDLFYECTERWKEILADLIQLRQTSSEPYREAWKMEPDLCIEWAFSWYVTIMQGYTHSENDTSWKPTKGLDHARAWTNKVYELPYFVDTIRNLVIENLDFAKFIKLYDKESMLFYCDPPYTPGSRVSQNNYLNEMSLLRHQELLNLLNDIKGQAVVSMYSDPLYEKELSEKNGWRRREIKHLSSIQNASSLFSEEEGKIVAKERATRTEVIWIKEHRRGLWD